MLTALAAATGVFLWSSQIARNNINVSVLYFLSVFTLMMLFSRQVSWIKVPSPSDKPRDPPPFMMGK